MTKFAKNKIKFYVILFVISGPLFLSMPVRAGSASLYLSPSSGTYSIGSNFSVKLKVDSGGTLINAAEGKLIFNPEEISVVSFSKTDSIFSLWTTEPTFSKSAGEITFGGGTTDNFSGTSGTIITITFKAEISATTQVNFSSGSVLAADGKGTNILSNMVPGIYVFQPKIINLPAEENIPLPIPSGAPAAPAVFSSTHPKEDEWYSNNNPEFYWELPSDVTGVSLLLHKNPTADPGSISDGLSESKKFENVEGGIWYLHIKFKNQYGWGKILHRKVLVALEPPIITELPLIANVGDILIMRGTSEYPDATVTIFVKKEGEEPMAKDIKVNEDGNWLFIYDKSLKKGTYQVWAEVTDSQGAKSNQTEKTTIAVTLPTLLKFGEIAIDYLTIIVTLIALIALLAFIIFFSWGKIFIQRKRIEQEVREARRSIVQAFKILWEETREQIEYFDKKAGLSKREKEIRGRLQKALNISKEIISKEVKDIEKELK